MKSAEILGLALVGVLAGCSSSSGDASPANAGDAGADAAPDATPAIDAGGPVIDLTPQKWTWAPVNGAFCRDGSPTGVAVNPGSGAGADKTMIFLDGGGACFNAATCALGNPSSFDYAKWSSGGGGAATGPESGLLDRTNAANPVKDWNFVYVPYCTGDVHAGVNPTATISGVKGTKFVGYTNITLDLQRIVPTFTNQSKIFLTGVSAGGFGAAANYVQVAQAFPKTPVFLLDDSGPPFEDPYLAKCLQTHMRTLWGLDGSILAACGSDCADPDNYLLDYSKHLGKAYPNVPFGFIDSDKDGIISAFFGFGLDSCNASLGSIVPGATYQAGIEDVRSKLAGLSNYGSFIFTGVDHTSLGNGAFYTRTTNTADGDTDAGVAAEANDAGGPPVGLAAWTTDLVVNGHVTTVGP